jgi:hypothetical protein
MSKKHKGAAPIPKGNQPHFGPQAKPADVEQEESEGAPASEQDAERHPGNGTAGEHPLEQPGGKQGANK